MRKMLLLVAAAGLLSLAAAQGVAADSGKTQCGGTFDNPGVFTGTTKDLVVPPSTVCIMEGGNVTHDVTVQKGASFYTENSSIGHDLTADGAGVLELGFTNGPLTVGHDVVLSGTSTEAQTYGGWDVCNVTVGHDLTVKNAQVSYEIEIGDLGPQDNEFCTDPNKVGHDVSVTNTSAGHIDVGNNSIQHDLTVSNNTTYDYLAGDPYAAEGIGVDDNTVAHDATCKGNNPGLTVDGTEDGPNHVGHKDDGCEAARS